MKLPPLENLRIFEAVARHRSFTAAAETLALSHSAVSRRVSELEVRLGVQLLQRTSRHVALTPAGAMLYEAAQEALKRIEEATAEILRPAQSPALLVSCERSLAMRWLIPRLSGFQDANPDISVYLSTGGGPIDLARANIDLAIRRADFVLDAKMISQPLFPEYVGPVHAANIASDTRLHTTGRPDAWPLWLRHEKSAKKPKSEHKSAVARSYIGRDKRAASAKPKYHDQYFDHFFLSLQAAEAGLGTAIAPLFMVADSLAAGRLTAPGGFIADGTQYIALLRKPLEAGTSVQCFVDWLRQAAEETLEQTRDHRRM
jgi:DNA-binding transcriptional LysR family regulator